MFKVNCRPRTPIHTTTTQSVEGTIYCSGRSWQRIQYRSRIYTNSAALQSRINDRTMYRREAASRITEAI
jgi:hypothetical protein